MPRDLQLRMRITIGISGTLALLLLAAPAARADRRSFIRAYEVATQPKGNLEFELWNDIYAPKAGFDLASTEHRFELEYGLTDRWDLALYHVFKHRTAGFGAQLEEEVTGLLSAWLMKK